MSHKGGFIWHLFIEFLNRVTWVDNPWMSSLPFSLRCTFTKVQPALTQFPVRKRFPELFALFLGKEATKQQRPRIPSVRGSARAASSTFSFCAPPPRRPRGSRSCDARLDLPVCIYGTSNNMWIKLSPTLPLGIDIWVQVLPFLSVITLIGPSSRPSSSVRKSPMLLVPRLWPKFWGLRDFEQLSFRNQMSYRAN